MRANIPCRLSYRETCTKEKKTEKWKQVRSAMELPLHRKASPPHSRRVDSLKEMKINNISDIFTLETGDLSTTRFSNRFFVR